MRVVQFRLVVRLVALAATTVSAATVVACGDDDARGIADRPSASSAPRQPGAGYATGAAAEKAEIEALYLTFIDASFNGRGHAVCTRLSSRLEGQLPGGESGPTDCEEAYGQPPAQSTGEAIYAKPRVLSMEIKGGRAVARVKTPDLLTFKRVRFLREGGDWKVDGDIDMGPF